MRFFDYILKTYYDNLRQWLLDFQIFFTQSKLIYEVNLTYNTIFGRQLIKIIKT